MSTVNAANLDTKKRVPWRVGLQNPAEKFLSAEPFGDKVTAGATLLKNKEVWILEINKDDSVFMKSHNGRYLSTDKFGNVSCKSDNRGEDEKFLVEYAKDGTGRWAFKNAHFQYYLAGTDDKVQCLAREASDENLSLWYVPLVMHPQVSFYNVNRRRYVHLNKDELQCTEVIPWGPNALITVDIKCGKYCFKSADNRYLNSDGSLTMEGGASTKFSLELRFEHDSDLSGIAFKDSEGRYLTAYGMSGTLKSRKTTVGKDELFLLEESHPQVAFIAHNGKRASVRTGLDVTASFQDETNKEIFQVEFDKKSQKWRILTIDGKYWAITSSGGLRGDSAITGETNLFQIIWQHDGKGVIKASNGKYIFNKPTGALLATSDQITEREKFIIKLVNRPLIILKGEYGFVSMRTSGSVANRLICNKSIGEVILMEHGPDGCYHLKCQNGKYWDVGTDEHINASETEPKTFVVEFHDVSLLTLKTPNGKYALANKVGDFRAVADDVTKLTMWRY